MIVKEEESYKTPLSNFPFPSWYFCTHHRWYPLCLSTVPIEHWVLMCVFREYIFPTRGQHFLPMEKVSTRRRLLSRGQYPFSSKARVYKTRSRDIRFLRVEIFSREDLASRVGQDFPFWKRKFPGICTNFCPALIAQLKECQDESDMRVPSSNSESCQVF